MPFWFGASFGFGLGIMAGYVLNNVIPREPVWPVDHAIYLKQYDKCIATISKNRDPAYFLDKCDDIAKEQARVRPSVELTK